MDKLIKDGKVAVLVSSGFGAGFSTWNSIEGIELDGVLAQMILDKKPVTDMEDYLEKTYSNDGTSYVCTLGVEDLSIEWLPEGTPYRIDEYDGSESLVTSSDLYSMS